MPEPEDQLRRLAAHRAEQVPAYVRATEPIAITHRRRPIVLVSIAAAVVIALVAAGFALWPNDDSSSVHVGTPASTPAPTVTTPTPTTTFPATTTTAERSCPSAAGDTRDIGGGADGSYARFSIVNFAASECRDRVVFSFPTQDGRVPAWNIHYLDGPVNIGGEERQGAALVLQVSSLETPPDDFGTTTPILGAPTAATILEIAPVEGFGPIAWAIMLPRAVRFDAYEIDSEGTQASQIVVDIPHDGPPKSMRCVNATEHYAVAPPADWVAEFWPGSTCSMFTTGEGEFVYVPNSDVGGLNAGVSVGRAGDGADVSLRLLESSPLLINGMEGTRTELEGVRDTPISSIGRRVYRITVVTPYERIQVSTSGDIGPEFDQRKLVVDQMAQGLTVVP